MFKKTLTTLVSALLIICSLSNPLFAASNLKQTASYDCKSTALAQLLNIATGSNYTSASFTNSSGLCINVNGKQYGDYRVTYHTDINNVTSDEQLQAIQIALSQSLPIVVEVRPGSNQHWVTIIRQQNSRYVIIDPADGKQKYLDSKYSLGAHDDYGYISLTPIYGTTSIQQNEVTTTNSSPSYFPRYYGSSNSIVDALQAIGVDSSYTNRKGIAQANGISNYSGTAPQNTSMLNSLKNGTLRR